MKKNKIEFTKMVASGNDFVLIRAMSYEIGAKSLSLLAQRICNRKFGIGADGLLILEKSRVADIKMRIFNADGSEAEMCGNGARCSALWASAKRKAQSVKLNIETKAGIIKSEVKGNNVKIKLTDPRALKLNIPIKVNDRNIKVNFINTGVPHTVVFVEGLDKIDVFNIGREIRYHKKFAPRGTNVDFVQVISNDSIKVRTYERGVEDETLACGTGSVASALLYAIRYPLSANHLNVITKSGEVLKAYFNRLNGKFRNVWLEGKARIVAQGDYYV